MSKEPEALAMLLGAKPATYTREKCERCGGLGTIKRPKNMPNHLISRDGRRRPNCPDCFGNGYIEVREKRES
jgi:DnaJ-class molecular chaperone